MRKRNKQILLELLKNAKTTDRKLAQKLDTSQSTVSRIRKKLEKDIIKKYTALPDFSRLNINLASVAFGRCEKSKETIIECLRTLSDKYPRIIYAGEGEGMGKNCMIVSLHRDFSDFMIFFNEFSSWCEGIRDVKNNFLISLKDSFQTFDLKNTVEDILKEKRKK